MCKVKDLWLVTVFVAGTLGLPTKYCDYDKFYKEDLEDCVPCGLICYEGSWSDCKRNCLVFYMTHMNCPTNKYWSKSLESCISCSFVCEPITRTDCRTLCKRFLDKQNTTQHSHSQAEISTNATTATGVKKQRDQSSKPDLRLIIAIPISVVLSFATALLLNKLVCHFKRKKKKMPIQVSDTLLDGVIALNIRGHEERQPLSVSTENAETPV